jgi:ABC-type branched-subunit amino acid transport system substrate-binding protein
MKKLKLGCLLPASGIMPNMGDDFLSGMQLGFGSDNLIVVPEFIDQGKTELVREKISKLISYDKVDLIAGLISSLVATEVMEEISRKKVSLIINNLGEFFPSQSNSPYYFYNSLHLWKSQWAMGKWAQETYGGNPTICYTFYDAGYHLHEAFRLGAMAAGAQDIPQHLLHLQPGVVDTTELIKKLEEGHPTHVHAILCGVDGKDFIKRYKGSEMLNNTPLTVAPFLVEDQMMSEIEELVDELPNAILWSYQIPGEENQKFITNYERTFETRPGVFSLLGYETGMVIKESILDKARNLYESLGKSTILGPRGKINLSTDHIAEDFEVYLRKPIKNGKPEPENQIMKTIQGVSLTDQHIQQSASLSISGWQNPYLCI